MGHSVFDMLGAQLVVHVALRHELQCLVSLAAESGVHSCMSCR